MKVRICMLSTSFPRFRGDLFGAFVFELARALAARGARVEVVAPHGAGAARGEEMGGVVVRRFRYFWPASWQRLAYGGGMPANLRRSWLARLQVPFLLLAYVLAARRWGRRADILHGHWSLSGLVALGAAGRGKALVLSVRGSDVHSFDRRWMRWLNARIAARMDAVVAVSEEMAARLRREGVAAEKIHVVYNGVDARFCPGDAARARRRLGLPAGIFVVLYVGLLVPVKGVEVLLEALSGWRPGQWLCALVGDGPLAAELRAQAAALGLAEQLRFAGRRPADEIPAWMQAADVLVLPSRAEGRPNVVLEAQACGLPVVATRVGGTPELVADGDGGLLVESGDSAGLRRALERLRADAAYREQLGRRARARIEAGDHSWAGSARQLEAIYRQVLRAA